MFNKAKIKEMEARIKELEQVIAVYEKNAVLVAIERLERTIKFTFTRAGKIIHIETMGMMSDNTAQWKQELLS